MMDPKKALADAAAAKRAEIEREAADEAAARQALVDLGEIKREFLSQMAERGNPGLRSDPGQRVTLDSGIQTYRDGRPASWPVQGEHRWLDPRGVWWVARTVGGIGGGNWARTGGRTVWEPRTDEQVLQHPAALQSFVDGLGALLAAHEPPGVR